MKLPANVQLHAGRLVVHLDPLFKGGQVGPEKPYGVYKRARGRGRWLGELIGYAPTLEDARAIAVLSNRKAKTRQHPKAVRI